MGHLKLHRFTTHGISVTPFPCIFHFPVMTKRYTISSKSGRVGQPLCSTAVCRTNSCSKVSIWQGHNTSDAMLILLTVSNTWKTIFNLLVPIQCPSCSITYNWKGIRECSCTAERPLSIQKMCSNCVTDIKSFTFATKTVFWNMSTFLDFASLPNAKQVAKMERCISAEQEKL